MVCEPLDSILQGNQQKWIIIYFHNHVCCQFACNNRRIFHFFFYYNFFTAKLKSVEFRPDVSSGSFDLQLVKHSMKTSTTQKAANFFTENILFEDLLKKVK